MIQPMEREFDAVVIGAGPAGEVVAGRLAERGNKRVALIERHLVGGECSFYACMPSKALLRPADALHEVERVPGAAETVTAQLDVEAALLRRDEVIHNLSDEEQLPWLQKRGIELFRGDGRLDGERRVRVGEDVLTAHDAVVIATGSSAQVPPIPGLPEAHAWTNREITTAKSPPQRLLVLGGGFVGVEMAQAWASFGSRVTVIEAIDRLIAQEEPMASEQVRAALERAGIEIRTGAKATEVSRDGGDITLRLEDGGSVSGDHLLVAIGRRPLTDDLGLETVQLEGGDYLKVDEHMRVNGSSWLYAVGDANGRSLLTHAGKYQARIAVDHILGENAAASTDGTRTPRVIFTEPQVAAVGLTLDEAREAEVPASAIDVATDGSAGASFYGRGSGGTSRFVVDTEREILVGATFVGADVNDFLHAATIAVVAEVPLQKIAHSIATFPTRTELWLKFVESYERERGVSLHASH